MSRPDPNSYYVNPDGYYQDLATGEWRRDEERDAETDVVSLPDTQQPHGRRLTIRPNRVVVHSYDDGLNVIVVTGPCVRRDSTLGPEHSAIYSSHDIQDGRVPAWVDEMMTSAGLSWDKPGGAQ